MTLERVEQHVETGLVKLPLAYWGKPRIGAVLAAHLIEIQTLEDAVWDLFDARHIDTADMPRLVIMGKLIGQDRHGFDLEDFRTAIKARALANRSDGSGPALGRVLVALLGAGDFAFHWVGAASIAVAYLLQVTDDEKVRLVQEVLPFARAAGVQINFFFQEDADVSVDFVWESITAPGVGTPAWSVRSL
jgi:hypothetical protein